MISTDRWPFVLREYLGAVGIIAGVTHVWPAIPAITLGFALILGVATRWVAALACVLLLAYAIFGLHMSIIGPNPPTAFGFLALTVALASTDPPPSWGLVPLRVYLGVAFWRATYNKIGAKWADWPGALQSFGTMNLPHESPWYRAFMTHVVFPHATLFAGLVASGEVAVGTCLILGLGTRIAAPIGAFLTLNYFLLKGDALWSVSNDLAFIVGLTVITITGPSRVFGLDGLIAPRHPVQQPAQGD